MCPLSLIIKNQSDDLAGVEIFIIFEHFFYNKFFVTLPASGKMKMEFQFKTKMFSTILILSCSILPAFIVSGSKETSHFPDNEDLEHYYSDFHDQTKITWRDRLAKRDKPKPRRLCCSPGAGNNGCGSCPSGKYDYRPFMGRYRPYWGGGCSSCCQSCGSYTGGRANSYYGQINLPSMTRGKGYNGNSRQTRCYECNGEVYNSYRSCRACTAGKRAGNPWGQCSNCPAGQYQGSNSYTSTGCTSCPAGKYSSSAGASSCTTCPSGRFNSGSGSTSCIGCDNGKYVSSDYKSCVNCPSGKYDSNLGGSSQQSHCLNCPSGKYQSSAGATSCNSCPGGQASNSGATSCTLCNRGQYSSGGASCQNCPSGQYSGDGASSCTSCPSGKFSPAGASACIECKTGYYNAGDWASCKECPMGWKSTATKTTCAGCPQGTQQPSAGMSYCDDCGVGTYQNQVGQAYCKVCAAGQYRTSNSGSPASCISCSAGKYLSDAGNDATKHDTASDCSTVSVTCSFFFAIQIHAPLFSRS
jgi:hypothetical protein